MHICRGSTRISESGIKLKFIKFIIVFTEQGAPDTRSLVPFIKLQIVCDLHLEIKLIVSGVIWSIKSGLHYGGIINKDERVKLQ